jgi:hypothetical protein
MAERNRRTIWGAMNAPGEDAAISRDSIWQYLAMSFSNMGIS